MKTTKPLADPSGRVAEPVTPERWNALTRHIKIKGKSVDSILHRLQGIGRGISWDRPEEQEIAA